MVSPGALCEIPTVGSRRTQRTHEEHKGVLNDKKDNPNMAGAIRYLEKIFWRFGLILVFKSLFFTCMISAAILIAISSGV